MPASGARIPCGGPMWALGKTPFRYSGRDHPSDAGTPSALSASTKRAASAERAGAAAVALASPSVGGVFKHCQVVRFGQLIQSIHVGRAAADVDWNDGPRARGDLSCHILRIETERVRVDVGKNRN